MKNLREVEDKDLEILIKAKKDAQERVEKDPSKANLEALEKASRMLAEKVGDDKELSFANRREALSHLRQHGYKISTGKLYQDCKAGMLRIQTDGSVLESDLNRYIKRASLVKPADIKEKVEVSELEFKRRQKEIEKLDEQIADLRLKREVAEGKYIPREDFEMELAARAAILEAGLRYMFQSKISEWVMVVSGDTGRISGLLELINRQLDTQLNEFASMKQFQVIFVNGE